MVLDSSSQEYPVNAAVSRNFILESTFFLLQCNDLSDEFIYNVPVYADDTTLYSKYD